MVDIACDPVYPAEVRIIAANYLYRTKELDLSGVTSRLIEAFQNASDPRIRMCLAAALGKTGSNEAISIMADALSNDPDYRVRCNILKGFESFSYARVEDLVYAALKDDNVHVARLAADYLVKYGNQQDALYYRSLSKGQYHWIVKAILYEAANRHLPGYFAITKANMQNELTGLYQRSVNPYEKGLILKALARESKNFSAIWEIAQSAETTALKTQSLEALQQIALDPDLKRQYSGATLARRREEFFQVFLEAIQSGDDAWIAIAASTINDPNAGLIPIATNAVTELDAVYQTLQLPRQIEAYNALGECLAKLKGLPFQPETPEYNHPIDWEVFHSLPDTLEAEIVTSQGNVQLALYKKLAPGTVVNFVSLIRDGFYNDKVVHRVVPNFVIQDGCPRGDGYGSLDYSIRSELPPVYYNSEGKIGMASAGRHTECTQWFITHSPTPHLDGRYTIFGEVTKGMEVVHNLQLGARVERIQIVNEIL
jgi:cyclophilin family peptidyl-prolyl cis-trans isomerase